MGIDIRDHGGIFGGGAPSPVPKVPITPIAVGHLKGASTIYRYPLAMSKSYIVLGMEGVNAGGLHVVDRKTLKTIKTLYVDPVDSGFISYNYRGLIVGDRYLVYSTSSSKLVVRDLKSATDTITVLKTGIGDAITSALGTDDSYGYIASASRLLRISATGTVVWENTDGADGGWGHGIFGEYNGRVYAYGNSGAIRVANATTGALVGGYYGFTNQPITSAYVANGRLVATANGSCWMIAVDGTTGVPSLGSSIPSNVYSAVAYDKTKNKILVGYNTDTSFAKRNSSSVYSLTAGLLEDVVSGFSLGNIISNSNTENHVLALNLGVVTGAWGNGSTDSPILAIIQEA